MAGKLPKAQSEALIVRWVDGELVIVDEATHVVHCLTDHAARVFVRCTGTATPEDIAVAEDLSVEIVTEAIGQLGRAGLLATEPSALHLTRRQLGSKAARATAIAAGAAPLLYSLVLAPAAANASPNSCVNVACRGTASTASQAQGQANGVCAGNPNCARTAHCAGTGTSNFTSFIYSGNCNS